MAVPQRSPAGRRHSALRLAVSSFGGKQTALGQSVGELPAPTPVPRSTPGLVEVRIRLDSEWALIEARRQGRQLAATGGFAPADRAIIAAIVSELSRNVLLFAAQGEIAVRLIDEQGRVGLLISATDTGPGIHDVARAMRDGYSTAGRLGIGLPGVKRLADEFTISCGEHGGTLVSVRKWRSP